MISHSKKLPEVFRGLNPAVIVDALKKELSQTVTRTTTWVSRKEHQKKLEKLLEPVSVFMLGNFFKEPAHDAFDKFQLEHEIVDQGVLRLFMANLEQLSERVARLFIKIFVHISTTFAFQTRQLLAEKLVREPFLLEKLYHFLNSKSDTACIASAEVLIACCAHITLARKLVKLSPQEEIGHSPFFIQLLGSVKDSVNLNEIGQIFKFLHALLLTHDEVAIQAINGNLFQLITTFNQLLSNKGNYLARFKSLFLFADLVQSRHLQPFVVAYTTKLDNFKIFYDWAHEVHAFPDRRGEFIKIFEVFRLFFLNPDNASNNNFKNFAKENYMAVNTIIVRAEQTRSYTDKALTFTEYAEVQSALDTMAGKPKQKKKKRFSRSIDSIGSNI